MNRDKKKKPLMCNHNTFSSNNTLIKVPKKTMVYPATEDYYCLYCKRFFKYKKDSEGKLSLVKD